MFVVVSGLPASGKSTLARAVAPRLSLALLDKDVILESLFDALGCADEAERRALSRAADAALLALARDNGRAVLTNWWHHDSAPEQLGALGGLLVEVYCDCPVVVAAQRCAARRRHPGHLDPDLGPGEIAARVAHLERTYPGPLRLGGPLEAVDTTEPVDVDELVRRIESAARPRH